MVVVRARVLLEGQTIVAAGAHVLESGEFGWFDDGTDRYLFVGDGTSTVDELIAAESYFVWKADLP